MSSTPKADERDVAMLDNLLTKMDEKEQQIGVLVAGGYHSHALTRVMRERGLSFVTVRPELHNLIEDDSYKNRMLGNVAPLDPIYSSHFQYSRITAPVLTLNGIDAFKDIVKEAKIFARGISLMDENGQPLSNAKILELARQIRSLGESKNNDDFVYLADAFDAYAQEVEKVLKETSNIDVQEYPGQCKSIN